MRYFVVPRISSVNFISFYGRHLLVFVVSSVLNQYRL